MHELEPSWGRAVSVWWLVFWRGIVGGAILGGVVGFIIGFVGALSGIPTSALAVVNLIIGGLIGIFWMIAVVRMALRKKYSDFRLALVPNNP